MICGVTMASSLEFVLRCNGNGVHKSEKVTGALVSFHISVYIFFSYVFKMQEIVPTKISVTELYVYHRFLDRYGNREPCITPYEDFENLPAENFASDKAYWCYWTDPESKTEKKYPSQVLFIGSKKLRLLSQCTYLCYDCTYSGVPTYLCVHLFLLYCRYLERANVPRKWPF